MITAFSGASTGSTRNNFGAEVGVTFTLGSNPVIVRTLGRRGVTGNTQTHTLTLYNSGGSSIASVSVNMSGATSGVDVFAALSTPVILTPGSSYFLYSTETNGGDFWYDQQNYTSTGDISSFGASFGFANVAANQEYVPTNFQYDYPTTAFSAITGCIF